jgi:hypothetical protein
VEGLAVGRNHLFSAGEGSFRAAMADKLLHPGAQHRLVFTDTLYEDADAYRFLVEGAAQFYDRRLNWSIAAADFPDYRVPADMPIEESCGNPEWREYLADLRARTLDAIPELVWIVEGRDPWEIYRDRRFLGNSGVDPCSEVAKRLALAEWRSANCYREGELFGPADVFTVGIDEHETERFYGGGDKLGIRRAHAKDGWIYEAPLIAANEVLAAGGELPVGVLSVLFSPLAEIGPASPRLYGMGYVHNNCGGFCCKAGQAHWRNSFIVQPYRYAYDAIIELKLTEYLGANVAMLTDRRGGQKNPMMLDAFAERLAAEPDVVIEYEPGDSGCGCMGVAA